MHWIISVIVSSCHVRNLTSVAGCLISAQSVVMQVNARIAALHLFFVLLVCNEVYARNGLYNTNSRRDHLKLNVHVISHAHIDLGLSEELVQCATGGEAGAAVAVFNMLDGVVGSLLVNPHRTYTHGELAFFIAWWQQLHPHTQDVVRQLVQQQRFEFVNGGVVQHDDATSHYSAMVSQMSLGMQFLQREFNMTPKVAWQLEGYGHSCTEPLLKGLAGYEAMYIRGSDLPDLQDRMQRKLLELVWRGSLTYGNSTDLLLSEYPMQAATEKPPAVTWFTDQPRWSGTSEPTLFKEIVDDPEATAYNVDTLVNAFVETAEQLQQYMSSSSNTDVLLLLDPDFSQTDPQQWFKNLDKLVHYINRDGRVNALYSTPANYFAAKAEEAAAVAAVSDATGVPQGWPLKTDDFFPVRTLDSGLDHQSGYYSSRPALKGMVRQATALLTAAQQMEVVAGLELIGDQESSFKLPLPDVLLPMLLQQDTANSSETDYAADSASDDGYGDDVGNAGEDEDDAVRVAGAATITAAEANTRLLEVAVAVSHGWGGVSGVQSAAAAAAYASYLYSGMSTAAPRFLQGLHQLMYGPLVQAITDSSKQTTAAAAGAAAVAAAAGATEDPARKKRLEGDNLKPSNDSTFASAPPQQASRDAGGLVMASVEGQVPAAVDAAADAANAAAAARVAAPAISDAQPPAEWKRASTAATAGVGTNKTGSTAATAAQNAAGQQTGSHNDEAAATEGLTAEVLQNNTLRNATGATSAADATSAAGLGTATSQGSKAAATGGEAAQQGGDAAPVSASKETRAGKVAADLGDKHFNITEADVPAAAAAANATTASTALPDLSKAPATATPTSVDVAAVHLNATDANRSSGAFDALGAAPSAGHADRASAGAAQPQAAQLQATKAAVGTAAAKEDVSQFADAAGGRDTTQPTAAASAEQSVTHQDSSAAAGAGESAAAGAPATQAGEVQGASAVKAAGGTPQRRLQLWHSSTEHDIFMSDVKEPVESSNNSAAAVAAAAAPPLRMCFQLKESVCSSSMELSGKGEGFLVVLYNPLSFAYSWGVRVPVVSGSNYAVVGPSGMAVPSQLLPVPEAVESMHPDVSAAAQHELVFMVEVAALGHAVYKIRQSLAKGDLPAVASDMHTWHAAEDLSINSKTLSVRLNSKTRSISHITRIASGQTFNYTHSLVQYRTKRSSTATGSLFAGQGELRPAVVTDITVVRGPVVKAIRETYHDLGIMITRLWAGLDSLEVQWLVNPSEKHSMDVFVHYNTDVPSEPGVWFTDANGREWQQRTWSYRPSHLKFDGDFELGGNMYPASSGATMTGEGMALSVAMDRAHGVVSQGSGQLHVLLHRTLAAGRKRAGRPEGATDTSPALGTHIISITNVGGIEDGALSDDTANAKFLHTRHFQQILNDPLQVAFSAVPRIAYRATSSGINGTAVTTKVKNVHVLTLQWLSCEVVLLRLSHMFQAGEHSRLAVPAVVDVSSLLKQKVQMVQEASLFGERTLDSDATHSGELKDGDGAADSDRTCFNGAHCRWAILSNLTKWMPNPPPHSNGPFYSFRSDVAEHDKRNRHLVTINPMEIRTFHVTVQRSGSHKCQASPPRHQQASVQSTVSRMLSIQGGLTAHSGDYEKAEANISYAGKKGLAATAAAAASAAAISQPAASQARTIAGRPEASEVSGLGFLVASKVIWKVAVLIVPVIAIIKCRQSIQSRANDMHID